MDARILRRSRGAPQEEEAVLQRSRLLWHYCLLCVTQSPPPALNLQLPREVAGECYHFPWQSFQGLDPQVPLTPGWTLLYLAAC